MKLRELLVGIEVIKIKARLDLCICNVSSDSKSITSSSLFIAIKGERRNGNDYIDNAVNNGAIAIITDDESVYEKTKSSILVKNARRTLSYVWSNYYKNPQKELKIIAITGTNGKTSTSYFLYNILKRANKSCGLISTIECLINDEKIETGGGSEASDFVASMTTPDPKILFQILSQMRDAGVEIVVMEASSHSLEQEKLAAIRFLCGAFTNLSSEHMDFHKNMESYFLSKSRLFEKCDFSVVNIDDEYGRRIKEKFTNTYTCSVNEKSDFLASNICVSDNGCEYEILDNKAKYLVKTKISGKYTVYNSMLAFAIAKLLNISSEDILEGIYNLKCIKGRLEKIEKTNIYIDYAHTPYAMENVINTVRHFEPQKRLIVLFGCGGDRDKEKRPKMGEIATKMADLTIITSDNSRSEDAVLIIKDILKGALPNSVYCIIPKREDAIKYAVKSLGENDVLLLLGKGHEEYEIDKKGKHYFNERKIVKSVLEVRK